MLKRWTLVPILLAVFTLSGCHGHLHHPPGHDIDGPGNSENAPGHD